MDLITSEGLKEKLDRGHDFRLVKILGEWKWRLHSSLDSVSPESYEEAREEKAAVA